MQLGRTVAVETEHPHRGLDEPEPEERAREREHAAQQRATTAAASFA
jgi:hypothetical protein